MPRKGPATEEKKDALQIARERAAAIRAAGGTLQRLDPLEKAAKKPTSLRLAINAKCYDCQGRDCDPKVRYRIGTCTNTKCPLHPVRPYQHAKEDDDEEAADAQEGGED